MLARSCAHCLGDLSPGELRGVDWRKQPALERQIRFLKLLKVKLPADVGRGVAADLIQQVKEQQPLLFQEACEKDRKGPVSLAAKLVIAAAVILAVASAIYALRRFGIL